MKNLKKLGLIVVLMLGASQATAGWSTLFNHYSHSFVSLIKRNPKTSALICGVVIVGGWFGVKSLIKYFGKKQAVASKEIELRNIEEELKAAKEEKDREVYLAVSSEMESARIARIAQHKREQVERKQQREQELIKQQEAKKQAIQEDYKKKTADYDAIRKREGEQKAAERKTKREEAAATKAQANNGGSKKDKKKRS